MTQCLKKLIIFVSLGSMVSSASYLNSPVPSTQTTYTYDTSKPRGSQQKQIELTPQKAFRSEHTKVELRKHHVEYTLKLESLSSVLKQYNLLWNAQRLFSPAMNALSLEQYKISNEIYNSKVAELSKLSKIGDLKAYHVHLEQDLSHAQLACEAYKGLNIADIAEMQRKHGDLINYNELINGHITPQSISRLPIDVQNNYFQNLNKVLELEAQVHGLERCIEFNKKSIAYCEAEAKKTLELKAQVTQVKAILGKSAFTDLKLNAAVEKTLKEEGMVLQTVKSVVSADVKKVLDHCELSHEQYETMVGNSLQKYLYEQNRDVFVEQAALFKDSQGRETLRSYIQAAVKSSALAMDVIKTGTAQEAVAATKLASVLHEATKLEAAIGTGLLKGAAVTAANAAITGVVIAACPEAGCLVLAQKVYDYVYFIQESGQTISNQLQHSANHHNSLPLDQRVESAAFSFSIFVTPLLSRFTGSIRFVEMMSSTAKAIKTEYSALRSYVTLTEQYTATYKGLKFPCVHEGNLRALIDTGKISTQAHVDQYVQTVSGPLTYLTSKCSEGVVKAAQTLQASTGSAAAFVSAEAKAAKDLSTQSSSPAVPQADKLAEPKKVEALQTGAQSQHKSAGEVLVAAAVENEVVYVQTPEGIVFAIENNAGPKHSVSSNAAPKSGGAGPANPKAVVPVQKEVQWLSYQRHIPPPKISWKDIIKATKKPGLAKYHPDVHIETLEKQAWSNGIIVKNEGHDLHKAFDCGKIIGAFDGKETQYVIIKCSSNTIHGHPISKEYYNQGIKK